MSRSWVCWCLVRPIKAFAFGNQAHIPREEPSPFPERFPSATGCTVLPSSLLRTSGLLLLHTLLLATVAEIGLQPLGGGTLLQGQHLLRPVPQDPILCKGKVAPWAQASSPGSIPGHRGTPLQLPSMAQGASRSLTSRSDGFEVLYSGFWQCCQEGPH